MRLFMAVTFDEPMLDWLATAQEHLWQAGCDGHYTERKHFHLTLVFIGETSWLGAAQSVLESIELPGFALSTTQLGRFARLNGDILWLGLEACDGLSALVEQLTAGLLQCGFQLEKRAYHPHITLVRKARLPRECDLALLHPPVKKFDVKGFSLMASDSSTGELVYSELGWRGLGVAKN